MAEESEEQDEEEYEEKGMVEEGEEVQVDARDPGGKRRSAGRPELTDDQRTFLIMQKSVNAT